MSEQSAPSKGQILEAIDREREAWERLLAEVGEARMIEPGLMGEWTFKDLAAHLTGWRARSLRRLEATALNQPEPASPWPAHLTDDDDINDWIYEETRGRLLGEVIDESRESYARLAEIVQLLPDDALTDSTRFPWLEGTSLADAVTGGAFFGHFHEEHEPDVRRWLERAR